MENAIEAKRAQTSADFNAKLNIALKEANETSYWLRLLIRTDYITEQEFASIFGDLKEILALLTSICRKTNK